MFLRPCLRQHFLFPLTYNTALTLWNLHCIISILEDVRSSCRLAGSRGGAHRRNPPRWGLQKTNHTPDGA